MAFKLPHVRPYRVFKYGKFPLQIDVHGEKIVVTQQISGNIFRVGECNAYDVEDQ